MRPGPHHQRGEHVSQVRNGDRWRVAGLDAATGRIAAERLTDQARAVFDNDYVRHHITLGYAATVHSAQGVTADTSHAVVGETASRAAAYVAMSRGRDDNHVYTTAEPPVKPTTSTSTCSTLPRCTRCAEATNTPPPTRCG